MQSLSYLFGSAEGRFGVDGIHLKTALSGLRFSAFLLQLPDFAIRVFNKSSSTTTSSEQDTTMHNTDNKQLTREMRSNEFHFYATLIRTNLTGINKVNVNR